MNYRPTYYRPPAGAWIDPDVEQAEDACYNAIETILLKESDKRAEHIWGQINQYLLDYQVHKRLERAQDDPDFRGN